MSILVEELKSLASMTNGKQHDCMVEMLGDARDVVVCSIHDVFTDDEIRKIKRHVKPKAKECYKNAFLLTELFPDKVQYVEGKFTCMKLISLEHAWNKVGDKYVDITMEMALKKNPKDEEYMSLGCYSYGDIVDVVLRNGYYGEIYYEKKIKTKFINKN